MFKETDENGFCSIVMAVYNGENYIREQLQSLFLQTRKPDEIIVSDDGSTDHTCEIIQEEFSKHPEIKTVLLHHHLEYKSIQEIDVPTHSNMFKCSQNFEFLARQVTMRYVFFCDQDDVWDLNKVEWFYRTSKEYPHAGLIFCDYKDIDEKLNPIRPSTKYEFLQSYQDFALLPPKKLLVEAIKGCMVPGMCMCLRNDALKRCIPFSHYTFHDYWCLLVVAGSYPAVYIPQPLVLYRHHSSNVTASTGNISFKSLMRHIHGYRETIWNDYSNMQDFKKRGYTIQLPDQFIEQQENWYLSRLRFNREHKFFACVAYILRSHKSYSKYAHDPAFYIINDLVSILDVKFDRIRRRLSKIKAQCCQ